MADDKRGRDRQARNADRRQWKREIAMELERGDETEPPIDETDLEALETELEDLSFPATGAEVVETIGDQQIASPDGSYTVEELVPETEEVFESPDVVRIRLQRPMIAAAMKRIVEASDNVQHVDLGTSQHETYEKTLRALKAIDADDDDEGVTVITDWIVEHIREKQKLPGSRAVRREAAKFCRENGYEIRNDEWLGV